MEKQEAKPADTVNGSSIEFVVDSFRVKCTLEGGKIVISAGSDLSGKAYEGALANPDLNEHERFLFGDVMTVYSMMEESQLEKRKIQLSDAGILSFPYLFQATKKSQVEKQLEVKLKEVELGETHKLLIKVGRLEGEIKRLDKQEEVLKEYSLLREKQDERVKVLEEEVRLVKLEVVQQKDHYQTKFLQLEEEAKRMK